MINMLVITGRTGRANAEYGELFLTAGLKPGNAQPFAFPCGVIEGRTA